MTSEATEIKVEVGTFGSVSALLYPAQKATRRDTTLILGHGAGGNQLSPFMRRFGAGLAAKGLDVITFNFLYSQNGRGAPDPKPKLELCYESVIESARAQRQLKANRLLIGGKSMGGRIASQVAGARHHNLTGLVFLGYPLHPPGRPDQLRDAHLKNIKAPMLFVQGSRDTFGTPDELRAIFKRDRLPATLWEIETGDHSFKVLKSTGFTQDEVYDRIVGEVVRWVESLSSPS